MMELLQTKNATLNKSIAAERAKWHPILVKSMFGPRRAWPKSQSQRLIHYMRIGHFVDFYGGKQDT